MKDYFNGANNLDDISNAARNIKLELEIPDEMPKYVPNSGSSILDSLSTEYFNNMLKEESIRKEYMKIGMFGFVSWRWIIPLSKWIGERKCLEVMAGRGWLSHALRTKGIDVIATDNFSWNRPQFIQNWTDTVTDIEKIDAIDAVEKYGSKIDILIMSWPFRNNTAYKVIKTLYEINPNVLIIYIGEGNGGSTANGDFFKSFSLIEDYEFETVASHYQSWNMIKDGLFLGKYTGI
ncbi:hypothetical protein [Bacillus toyonensis]|uniref:hypothetical protein n=1 Tax=Bacillus toyonensis TaxID=155322 RepID=UPI002E1E51C0|nr:hypothetical protein [Bacillus toyonensis]